MATVRFQQDWGSALILDQLYQNPYNYTSPCSPVGTPLVRVGTVYGIPDAAVGGDDDIPQIGGINYRYPDINGLADYTPGMRAISLLCKWSTGLRWNPTPPGYSPSYIWSNTTTTTWPAVPDVVMFKAPEPGVLRVWGNQTTDGTRNLRSFINGVYIGTIGFSQADREYEAGAVALETNDEFSWHKELTTAAYFTFLPYSWAAAP